MYRSTGLLFALFVSTGCQNLSFNDCSIFDWQCSPVTASLLYLPIACPTDNTILPADRVDGVFRKKRITGTAPGASTLRLSVDGVLSETETDANDRYNFSLAGLNTATPQIGLTAYDASGACVAGLTATLRLGDYRDYNGDGFEDLLLGANRYDPGNRQGRV